MKGWLRVSTPIALILTTLGLAVLMVYLFRQGLGKASLWATFLVLPFTVISAVAGVWAIVLAARTPQTGSEQTEQPPSPSEIFGSKITRSGSIRQNQDAGSAVAHSGVGDIIFNGSELADLHEPPDPSDSPSQLG
jgi:hypothetical protein